VDIAVSAVILILLLLPALLFRAFIIKSDSLENPLDTSLKTELGIIFLIGLCQHLCGYLVLKWTGLYNIHLDQLYFILNGTSEKIETTILRSSFLPFLCYTLLQIVVGISFSLLLKWLILKYYLDIRFSFIPISNEWDQVLSGRLYEYDRLKRIKNNIIDLRKFNEDIILSVKQDNTLSKEKRKEEIEEINSSIEAEINELKGSRKVPDYNYVEIDVLVNTLSGDMIYKGRVYKYFLGKDNTLDKIILKDAFRRKFIDVKDSESEKLEFYQFESKLFIIKYSEIKNLNVRYTFIEEDRYEDEFTEEDEYNDFLLAEIEIEEKKKKEKKKKKDRKK